MSLFILSLADQGAILETVGGKGMSLAILSRAGLPVPGGFHVTTNAYRQFVAENALQPQILKLLTHVDVADEKSFEMISHQIGDLFEKAAIPEVIRHAISSAYLQFKNAPVAVRSSATAEDLPEASFAGQQDTYLNICGEAAVLDAVKRCWASLWTARAIAYRLKNGIDQKTVAIAVVVQQLVSAEAAGVLFTVNPMNGKRDQLVMNAAWGLGEAIVSGMVTPDMVTVDKHSNRIVSQLTAEKKVMTVRAGSGTQEQLVPVALQRKSVLSRAKVRKLAGLSVRVEQLYGVPMDIEWAFSAGKFSLLQARPITSLPESPLEWISTNPKATLMRMSFAEFVPEPVSPLFATLGIPIARNASFQLMANYLKYDDPNVYLFTVVNGYVYVGMVFDLRMAWAIVVALSAGTIRKMFTTSQVRWTAIGKTYRTVVEKWQEKELAQLPAAVLLEAAKEVFGCTAEYYTVAQSGPIPSASSSELSFTRYYNALVKRKNDPLATTFLLGLDTLPLSAEKSLFDLAKWIKTQLVFAQEFMQMSTKEIIVRYQAIDEHEPKWVEFRSRFDLYLCQFGHIVYDLDFAKSVPADDPVPLIDTLKAALVGKASDPYERQRQAIEKREQAQKVIFRRLGALRKRWFTKLLAWAQDCGPKREDCISDLGFGYPLLRKMFFELGRRLAINGVIQTPEDIYYLEAEELESFTKKLDRGEFIHVCTDEVAKRRINLIQARNFTPPMALPEKSLFGRMLVHESRDVNVLKGVGASTGKVTARACVLRDPDEFNQMQPGDVVVAVTTTPAWTPLFAVASAVVTEIGGPLSHSSIVAREYGIPAVLGAGGATRRIHTGQMVTVDGNSGTVTLFQDENDQK